MLEQVRHAKHEWNARPRTTTDCKFSTRVPTAIIIRPRELATERQVFFGSLHDRKYRSRPRGFLKNLGIMYHHILFSFSLSWNAHVGEVVLVLTICFFFLSFLRLDFIDLCVFTLRGGELGLLSPSS